MKAMAPMGMVARIEGRNFALYRDAFALAGGLDSWVLWPRLMARLKGDPLVLDRRGQRQSAGVRICHQLLASHFISRRR